MGKPKSTINEENFNAIDNIDVIKCKGKTRCGFGSLVKKFSVEKSHILNILKSRDKILREFESSDLAKTKMCL